MIGNFMNIFNLDSPKLEEIDDSDEQIEIKVINENKVINEDNKTKTYLFKIDYPYLVGYFPYSLFSINNQFGHKFLYHQSNEQYNILCSSKYKININKNPNNLNTTINDNYFKENEISPNLSNSSLDCLDIDFINSKINEYDVINEDLNESKLILKIQKKEPIDWKAVLKSRNIYSMSFIENNLQNLGGWYMISKYLILSEVFIRKHKYNVDWFNISKYQCLSIQFIYEFQLYVNWEIISQIVDLPEEFIRLFKNKIHWKYILKKFKTYSFEFKNDFIEYYNNEISKIMI